MDMAQNKKVIIMVAVIGVLVIALACVFLIFAPKGVNNSAPPPAVATGPGAMPSPGAATAPHPGAPMGVPGAGGAPSPMSPAAASPMTPAPAAQPTSPSSSTTHRAKTGQPSTHKSAANGGAAGSPATAALPGVIADPFAGGPPTPRIVRKSNVDERPYVPIISVPAVNSSEQGNGASNKARNDQFFNDSAVPDTMMGQSGLTGRNAGWIAVHGAQSVTDYYVDSDGSYHPVVVGSVIAGRQVKSIEQDYMVVVNQATGVTETLTIQSHH
jgi:hypothetical protein